MLSVGSRVVAGSITTMLTTITLVTQVVTVVGPMTVMSIIIAIRTDVIFVEKNETRTTRTSYKIGGVRITITETM